MSNPTITEVDVVIRRWLRLAHDEKVSPAARKVLRVCAEDLANAVQIDLPADYNFSDVPNEHPSGAHT